MKFQNIFIDWNKIENGIFYIYKIYVSYREITTIFYASKQRVIQTKKKSRAIPMHYKHDKTISTLRVS